MGAFDGLKDAKRGFSSNTIKAPGDYIVRIDKCEFFKPENTEGELWKNTLTVLKVIVGESSPGEIVNTFFKFKDTAEGRTIFQQNLKGFLAGVLGQPDAEVDGDVAFKARQADSPLYGLVTRLRVTERASKKNKIAEGPNAGQPRIYPVYSWSEMLSAEEIVAAIGPEGVAKYFPNGL